MGVCAYVIVHTILPPNSVISWIELGGKLKWLPLNFGYHDVLRTAPIVVIMFHWQKTAMQIRKDDSDSVWSILGSKSLLLLVHSL